MGNKHSTHESIGDISYSNQNLGFLVSNCSSLARHSKKEDFPQFSYRVSLHYECVHVFKHCLKWRRLCHIPNTHTVSFVDLHVTGTCKCGFSSLLTNKSFSPLWNGSYYSISLKWKTLPQKSGTTESSYQPALVNDSSLYSPFLFSSFSHAGECITILQHPSGASCSSYHQKERWSLREQAASERCQ
jgi:hypothetical protein